tara:strand:- start:1382 stop:1732 length:351 start_codon:yes stop_codon:yes gene_type:complete
MTAQASTSRPSSANSNAVSAQPGTLYSASARRTWMGRPHSSSTVAAARLSIVASSSFIAALRDVELGLLGRDVGMVHMVIVGAVVDVALLVQGRIGYLAALLARRARCYHRFRLLP